jgi:hypothetical protein
MTFKIMNVDVKSVLLLCLVLAAAVSFDVVRETNGAQADVDKILHLIAQYTKAVDTADVTLVREIETGALRAQRQR